MSAHYAKQEGTAGRMSVAPLAAVVLKASGRGREYLAPGDYPLPSDEECLRRLDKLDVEPPQELLPAKLTRGNVYCLRADPLSGSVYSSPVISRLHAGW